MRRLGCVLGWLVVPLAPLAALAADQAVRGLEPGSLRFWGAMGAVQFCALLGYGCSSLKQWAGWIDDAGGRVTVLERRLRIVQGMLIGFLAGNAAYYGGFYYFGLAEVPCFVAAAFGAFGGEKFIAPAVGRLSGMFKALFGNAGANEEEEKQ
jgi:hypothetical protein